MSIKKLRVKSFLIIIGIFILFISVSTLDNTSIKDISSKSNENTIYRLYTKIIHLESFGSIAENPIFINGSATGLAAHNWTWAESQDWCSGSGTLNDPYIIEDLYIDGKNQSNCIEIHNSAKFLIIRECTVFNSKTDQGTGIFLQNVSNSKLIDNDCDYNAFGVLMDQCNNNNITGNSASFNTWAGFHLSRCDNNTISNNVANNNVGVVVESIGIYLELSDFNLISENTADYNKYGIWLSGQVSIWGSHNNTIANNTASYNEVGIILFGDFGRCYNNTVSGNTVSNNLYYGIRVSRSPQNVFLKNKVRDNDNGGIYIYKESHNNTFTENIILNNDQIGLRIGYDCYWNLVYYNCFNGNGINAQDDTTDNEWDNGDYGNYWDDYNGVDADDNDIGDTPYDVPPAGSSVDNFPLIICPFSITQDGGEFPIELIIIISSVSGGVVIAVVLILLIRRKSK